MAHPEYKHVGAIEVRATEECAELVHILCKVRRFGVRNWHPDDQNKTPNYILVLQEIEDLETVLRELKKEYLEVQIKEASHDKDS